MLLWWAVLWRSFSACRGVGVGQGGLAAGEGARHGSPRVAAGHRASPWDWGGPEGLAGRVSWLAAKKLAVVMLAGQAPSWVWVGRRSARAAAGLQAQTGGTLRLGGPRGAGRPTLVAIHQVHGSHLVGGCPVRAAELGLGGPPVYAGRRGAAGANGWHRGPGGAPGGWPAGFGGLWPTSWQSSCRRLPGQSSQVGSGSPRAAAGPQAQTGGTVGLGGPRGAGLPGLVACGQLLGRHVVACRGQVPCLARWGCRGLALCRGAAWRAGAAGGGTQVGVGAWIWGGWAVFGGLCCVLGWCGFGEWAGTMGGPGGEWGSVEGAWRG